MHSICICTTYISKHILYYIHVFNLTTNDDDDDDNQLDIVFRDEKFILVFYYFVTRIYRIIVICKYYVFVFMFYN